MKTLEVTERPQCCQVGCREEREGHRWRENCAVKTEGHQLDASGKTHVNANKRRGPGFLNTEGTIDPIETSLRRSGNTLARMEQQHPFVYCDFYSATMSSTLIECAPP